MKKLVGMTLFCLTISLGLASGGDQKVDTILGHYFKIQAALAGDTTTGIDDAARSIVQVADSVEPGPEQQKLFAQMAEAARKLQGLDLEEARTEFFNLSKPLLAYLHQHYQGDQEYFRFYCDMAKKGWIQAENDLRNPYYGSSMLKCGELIG